MRKGGKTCAAVQSLDTRDRLVQKPPVILSGVHTSALSMVGPTYSSRERNLFENLRLLALSGTWQLSEDLFRDLSRSSILPLPRLHDGHCWITGVLLKELWITNTEIATEQIRVFLPGNPFQAIMSYFSISLIRIELPCYAHSWLKNQTKLKQTKKGLFSCNQLFHVL